MAQLLLEKGANVNAKDKYGSTPLDCAIGRGNKEMMSLLRANGGRVGRWDTWFSLEWPKVLIAIIGLMILIAWLLGREPRKVPTSGAGATQP